MSKDTGGPAFPCIEPTMVGISSDGEERYENEAHGGMTLRDAFAIAVLPAMVSAYVEANGRCVGTEHIHYNCAAHAYKMADAMLTERSKQ